MTSRSGLSEPPPRRRDPMVHFWPCCVREPSSGHGLRIPPNPGGPPQYACAPPRAYVPLGASGALALFRLSCPGNVDVNGGEPLVSIAPVGFSVAIPVPMTLFGVSELAADTIHRACFSDTLARGGGGGGPTVLHRGPHPLHPALLALVGLTAWPAVGLRDLALAGACTLGFGELLTALGWEGSFPSPFRSRAKSVGPGSMAIRMSGGAGVWPISAVSPFCLCSRPGRCIV